MVVVIGAGKTGRGFLARLLFENGEPFILVDKDKNLVDRLQNGYRISFFSNVRPEIEVQGYRAVYTDDSDCPALLAAADRILVSVGGGNIADVAEWLASMVTANLLEGPFQNIIFCENARDPGEKARKVFLENLPEELRDKADAHFGFADAAVFCTTVEKTPGSVDIGSENYPVLPFDAAKVKGELPETKGFQPVSAFQNILIRKIYTYNAASGIIAYLGWWKKYKVYGDAANDPQILKLLDRNYQETGRAICAEYGYTAEDQAEFAALSKAKFCDRTIVDTVVRNAREPQRKLSAGERIVGPALLIEKYGGDSGVLALTAAAALLYTDKDDAEWEKMKASCNTEELFGKLSGLDREHPFVQKVSAAVKNLVSSGRGVLPEDEVGR